MIESGSSLGLALKAAERLGISGYIIGQKLERNEAVLTGVFGFVDDTHASTTNFFDYAVVRYGLADQCEGLPRDGQY